MKRYRIPSYCPDRDTEFCEYIGDFIERYVNHDPLSDESIARHRRVAAFMQETGLTEEPHIPSFAHTEIFEFIDEHLDHTSQWWLQVGPFKKKIPFFMVEPYNYVPKHYDGFVSLIVPEPIAPYGGGPFNCAVRYRSPTTSVLITNITNRRYLKQLEHSLIVGAAKLPDWNSVSEHERKEAQERFSDRRGQNEQ